MRFSAFIRIFLLFSAFISPALLLAQFQEPTQEELKMTSDPKAPGAAAVFLNVEEITDDGLHYHRVYARIKVLTEKGKELATVEIPYERSNYKVVNIKARTIHSDGTVIPLAGKPEDLLIAKSVDRFGESTQFNKKVFNLPSAEVGSILEYSYDLGYDDYQQSSPHWEIQRPYYVHKAHYIFIPFKSFLPGLQNQTSMYMEDEHGRVINTLIWWPILPSGVTVKQDAAGHYSIELSDIPAAPDEEWMPPVQSILYKVFFYYKAASSARDFWVNDAKLWSKDVDHFAEDSKTLKDAVGGLISPADSELDKAKKIYKAVQALDNTDYSRKKTDAERKQLNLKGEKHAEDTWKQKSGDSEEIAMLYLAMLRAAGLTAYAEKVVNRQQGLFDISYLTLRQLDDTLVVLILSNGSKEVELDPGEKMCPFGTVNWRHSSAGGLSQSAKGASAIISSAQQYIDNKTIRAGDVTLDGQGAFTGIFRISMTGQQALYWRQQATTNDETEVKKLYDKSLETIFPEGVEAHIDSFSGLNEPDVDLIAVVKAQGNLGAATAKRMMLPAYFFETRGAHPFVAQEKRLTPVDMQYSEIVTEQVTYHLPAGFTVEGAPQDGKIAWPQHALFLTKSVAAPGTITILHSLARAFTFAKPEEYQDLRGFYQKIAAADEAQLVLTTAPATPKGN